MKYVGNTIYKYEYYVDVENQVELETVLIDNIVREEFEFNKQGEQIRHTSYSVNGKPVEKNEYSYDESGKKAKERVSIYDENGIKIEEILYYYNYFYDENGVLITYSKSIYNANNKVSKVYEYDTTDKLLSLEEYTYYENGNVEELEKSKYMYTTEYGQDVESEETWKYYENGNINKYYSSQYVRDYWGNWREIKRVFSKYYENGKQSYYSEYELDIETELSQEVLYEYSETGVLEICFVAKYDQYGNEIQYLCYRYNDDGTYQHEKNEYIYDKNNRLIQSLRYLYDENGQLIEQDTEKYVYNENGKIIKTYVYDKDGLRFCEESIYDENGNNIQCIRWFYYADGSVSAKEIYNVVFYDGEMHRELTQTIYFDEDGNIIMIDEWD